MKTKLGQNFLINKDVAKKEISIANISKKDIVLEIGPGNGILTNILAEKAKKVIAVELDKKLFNNLKGKIPNNVTLINDDILNINFKEIENFNKIVSNLPFQISSPITFKLLEKQFDLAVLIYQKEFGQRLIAKPNTKDYSRITVNIYYKAECELIDIIPKEFFNPKPKVDGCIIKMIPRKKPPFFVENEEFFLKLTKNLFNHRRKKIKYTIKKYIDYRIIDNFLLTYLDKRIENLSPEEVGFISNIIYNKL